MSKIQHSERLQNVRNIYFETLSNLIGFQKDTSESYGVLKKNKEDLIKYFESGKSQTDDLTDIPKIIEMIKSDHKKIDKYPVIIYTMSLVYAVANFEAYLSDTLKELLKVFPTSLSSSKKSMTYEDIFRHDSSRDILDTIIQKELIELSFKNITEQIEYLSSKFNISFLDVKDGNIWESTELDIEKLAQWFSIRNIILHNNSIINSKFLKDNKNSKFKEGDKIILHDNEVLDAILFLLSTGFKITQKAIIKIDTYHSK